MSAAAADSPDRGVPGRLYDGRSARVRAVRVWIDQGRLCLAGDFSAGTWSVPLRQVRISERLNAAPRQLKLPNGAHVEVDEQDPLDAALAAGGWRDGWVVRWQRHGPAALAAVIALAGVLWIGYHDVLPLAARVAAPLVSPRLESFIGAQAVQMIDRQYFSPSKLPAGRQAAIRTRLEAVAPHDRNYELRFRAGTIGANAIALPGGIIVVTDDLVALAPNDDAVVAVLAHELGHLHGRHFMRRLISGTVTGAVATLFVGDASAVVAAIPATLADLSYSRDMEREADAFGVKLLREHGLAPGLLANMLERLQAHAIAEAAKKEGEKPTENRSPWPAYLSTHPDTDERIRVIRAADSGAPIPQ